MDYSHIELELPRACIEACSASGDASEAVAYWLARPEIAAQFEGLTLLASARILYGYGAWEVSELTDRSQNIARLLWLACGDVENDPENTLHECHMAHAFLEGHGYSEELASLA